MSRLRPSRACPRGQIREWAILAMSLPKLARFINDNLSSGQAWDRVSVTGLFESLNREDGRHGGWHKGRYRVRRMPLADSAPEFEAVRARCAHAAVVAARPGGYVPNHVPRWPRVVAGCTSPSSLV